MYWVVGMHGALLLMDEYVSSPREESSTTATTVVDRPVQEDTHNGRPAACQRQASTGQDSSTRARCTDALLFGIVTYLSSDVCCLLRLRQIENAKQVASFYSAQAISS